MKLFFMGNDEKFDNKSKLKQRMAVYIIEATKKKTRKKKVSTV